MKKIKFIGMLLLATMFVFTSCKNDPEDRDFPEEETMGEGTEASPYTVVGAIKNQGQKDNTDYKYVKGYIVGIWEGKDESGADLYPDNFAKFEAPFYTNANILIAASANETNTSKMVCVQLPAGDIRTALNLVDNAGVLGKEVLLCGALEAYNKLSGMKSTQYFQLTDGASGGTKPGGSTGGGTETNPYDVATAMSNQTSKAAWVKGYIVGGVKNDDAISTIASAEDVVFGASNVRATAVLLADSKTETDYTKCVIVNLPSGTIRAAVNLLDNPGNLGKELTVNGTLRTYFGIAGVRDLTAHKLEGETEPSEPGTEDFNVPEMSIADVRTLWSGSAVNITDKKKIVGVVISDIVGGNSTSKKNITIASEDNSAGVTVRAVGDLSFELGDKIEILAEGVQLSQYANSLQLNNVPNAKMRKVGTATVTPKSTTIAEVISNFANYESTLVTVSGTITSENGKWGDATKHQSNELTKDSDKLILFVSRYTTFVDTDVPTGEVSVTGIAGINNETYQIIVRNLDDVK